MHEQTDGLGDKDLLDTPHRRGLDVLVQAPNARILHVCLDKVLPHEVATGNTAVPLARGGPLVASPQSVGADGNADRVEVPRADVAVDAGYQRGQADGREFVRAP